MERWCLSIDIEGFGKIYEEMEARALLSLGALMEGIYCIGSKWCPSVSVRIFAHQIGDGFIIVGTFGKESLEIPVTIGIALMQHVLLSGGIAKAGLAEGRFADVTGCYPECLRDAKKDKLIKMGRSIMTIFPVMGTALIRAIKLTEKQTGSLFLVEETLRERIPKETKLAAIGDKLLAIDWLHTDTDLLRNVQETARLHATNTNHMERQVRKYIEIYKRAGKWKENTLRFLQLESG